jgi:hypothetical protein
MKCCMRTQLLERNERETALCSTHAMEAANCHQNSHAIKQLSRHRRQPAPILQSEGVVVMDRLNRRRAKQSGSAAVRIEFALLRSKCKTAREWETSTCMRNIGVRASTSDRQFNNKMTVLSPTAKPNYTPMSISRSSRSNRADLQP